MREIKFRQLIDGKFSYFGFANEDTFIPPMTEDMESSPVMQYTGLKDKNGVEIYEGDVVQDANNLPCRLLVRMDEFGCFVACNNNNYDDFVFLYDLDFDVIGNIYQNRELLEG